MRPYSLPCLLFLLAGSLSCLPAAAQSSINLSYDLITLGIAKQNLEPNTPTLDAQPLVSAAVQYAQRKNVPLLIADPGTYYFLTAPSGPAYVFLGNVSNLTIDFQGSNLKIQDGQLRIFELEYCKSVTLRNFTVDQIVPRYTQVRLSSVNANKGTIFYSVPAGWADPATFTATSGFGTPQLFAAFYRNNKQVAATSLAHLIYPSPVRLSRSIPMANRGQRPMC